MFFISLMHFQGKSRNSLNILFLYIYFRCPSEILRYTSICILYPDWSSLARYLCKDTVENGFSTITIVWSYYPILILDLQTIKFHSTIRSANRKVQVRYNMRYRNISYINLWDAIFTSLIVSHSAHRFK